MKSQKRTPDNSHVQKGTTKTPKTTLSKKTNVPYSTKEIHVSGSLPEVLGQLAGGEEPDGEVSLEQEADNLVNCEFFTAAVLIELCLCSNMLMEHDSNIVFLYGTALMFKSVVDEVAHNDGWGHIESSYWDTGVQESTKHSGQISSDSGHFDRLDQDIPSRVETE